MMSCHACAANAKQRQRAVSKRRWLHVGARLQRAAGASAHRVCHAAYLITSAELFRRVHDVRDAPSFRPIMLMFDTLYAQAACHMAQRARVNGSSAAASPSAVSQRWSRRQRRRNGARAFRRGVGMNQAR